MVMVNPRADLGGGWRGGGVGVRGGSGKTRQVVFPRSHRTLPWPQNARNRISEELNLKKNFIEGCPRTALRS